MFVLFDGIKGTLTYFENDTEKFSYQLGDEFLNKDMFFSVCFCNTGNLVELINRKENDLSINRNQEIQPPLDIKNISSLFGLED